MFFGGLAAFLMVLTAEARVGNSTESSCCTETPECLMFELICQTEEYEIRRYDSVKWVSTSFTLSPLARVWWLDFAAMVPAFMRMRDYFVYHGIAFTATPGAMKIPEEKDSWMSNLINTHEYTIYLLLPSEHQVRTPQPTNPKVEIVETPEMYVYVKSYKGFVNEDATQAELLFQSLGMSSEFTPHFAVGYNSPMNSNPHSEVWIIADGKPKCPE